MAKVSEKNRNIQYIFLETTSTLINLNKLFDKVCRYMLIIKQTMRNIFNFQPNWLNSFQIKPENRGITVPKDNFSLLKSG